MKNKRKTYLTGEVAKELDIHANTVRSWEKKGFLKAQRDYRNYRVFPESELLKAKLKLAELRE